MKKNLLILLLLVSPLLLAQHTLQQLEMKVMLRHDGSADIQEWRHVEVSEKGTEGFITFNRMPDMEVCNLQVNDEKGTEYIVEPDWDVERTRAEKKNRCGYNRTEQGLELCWGLGEAGMRVYHICYTITNLVKAYNDYDGFCHSFYEAANAPAQAASLEIFLEHDSLTIENAAIWTFGYYGIKGISNGLCYATADEPMPNRGSIIVLLQLQKGLLEPALKKDTLFSETVKRRALEGSDYNLEDAGLSDSVSARLGNRKSAMKDYSEAPDAGEPDFGLLFSVLAIIIAVIAAAISKWRKNKEWRKEQQRIRTVVSQALDGKKYEEIPYFRNLPLKGNLLLSGALLGTIDLLAMLSDSKRLKIQCGLQQLYDAFILRMLYKKQISLAYDEHKGKPRTLFRISEPVMPKPAKDIQLNGDMIRISSLPENEALDDSAIAVARAKYSGYINDAGIEYHLQKFLYDAAGDDHLLQPDELKNFVKQNPIQWRPFATLLAFLTEGTVEDSRLKTDDVQQVVGFLRYLRDFSLVAERNIQETSLWKEYLVYASLYGIADQVRKDMKRIAPDVVRLDQLVPPEKLMKDFTPLTKAIASSVVIAHSYQTSSERTAIAYKHAREREHTRSSGGFGSSSFSGGGGYTGGGGSGFR